MTIVRKDLSKAVILWAVLGVTGCASGEDWVMREAREQCAAEGPDPKGKAYDDCVAKRSDALYAYWMRVMKTKGD